MNYNICNLTLKTSDISIVTDEKFDSDIGGWSNYKQKQYFNINIKKIMGNEMYDKYDTFMLRLNQISYSASNAFSGVDKRQCFVQVEGLQFLNATYNARTGNNSNKYVMYAFNVLTTSNTIDLAPNISICNFQKSGENITLSFELIQTIDNLAPTRSNNASFPLFLYNFDIIGINKN
jgi:hypothetical protein